MIAAQNSRAQNAAFTRDFNGLRHDLNSVWIFAAQVDIALGRANGDTGDHHPFDQGEGIALHDHPVGKGAAVALIGVADDVFLIRLRTCHRVPFDSCREPRATTATQPAFGDFGHDLGARHTHRAAQANQSAMRAVVVQIKRVDHATAGECQAGLLCKKRDIGNRTVAF